MAPRPSEEFKRDAVRITLTSGLTGRQASSEVVLLFRPVSSQIKMDHGFI